MSEPERAPYPRCPSAVAGGREDRCGLFAFPRRCTEERCTMVDAPPSITSGEHERGAFA